MKPDQKVIVVIALLPILFGALVALLLPRFINKQPFFINKAEIVRFVSPQTNPADIAQEYHLWLKIETTRYEFDKLIAGAGNETAGNTPIEKDEMKSERLVGENPIQDMLIIKGFVNEEAVTNTGATLRISKYITLVKENIRPLYDEAPLANPQMIPQKQFQPQTDIYQTTEGDKALLYIHLESGIKMQKASNTLSLTITYLKNNNAIQSQTLPLFSY